MSFLVEFRFNAEESSTRKTSVWDVISEGSFLGKVKWLSSQNQYCFMPGCGAIMTRDSMAQISSKITRLTEMVLGQGAINGS
jgi:hypothetical protein